MLTLSEATQSDIIEAFNSTSRYLDDLLTIDNNFFDSMVNRIYPSECQLNKANVSDTQVRTKMFCDRRLAWLLIQSRLTALLTSLINDVPRSTSFGVYK